jgi:hypothetical protein
MRARLALAASAVLSLLSFAGCDPVVSLSVPVTVSPAAQSAYKGGFPAQVVVYDEQGSHMVGAKDNYWRIGVLCEASAAPVSLAYERGGIGCAAKGAIDVYLLPVPAGDAYTCGPAPSPQHLSITSVTEKPWAHGVAFATQQGCGNYSDSVPLTLSAPAASPAP